ncbi:hypothetical protein WJU23_04650 [Prosthecobacter sp. SYSU 5D2]|uniref:hypothetical protein n=1 Tax=Prosthecobacter sp. SYSU 5D2 TaxID=3134134 RepID=UPI0031FEE7BA
MPPLRHALIAVLLTFLPVPVLTAATPASAPATLRTTRTGDALSVPMALSYHQVVLERKSGPGWKPLAVLYPRTLNREQMRDVSFPLPVGVADDEVRVLGYRTPKFPSRFTYAKHSFSRPAAAFEVPVSKALDRLKSSPKAPTTLTQSPATETENWELRGTRLFYSHAARGLQVLDVSDPTNPLRTGSLRVPVEVQRMFVLNAAGTEVLLIGPSTSKEHPGALMLLLIHIQHGEPMLTGSLRLEGQMTDAVLNRSSTELQILSSVQAAKKGRSTLLTRLELIHLEKPKIAGKTTFAGNRSAFRIQDGRLMVSVREAGQKRLHEVPVEGGAGGLVTQPAKRPPVLVMGYELSVGGRNLKAQNAGDPTELPVEMTLFWRTDRVIPAGDYLLQVEDGGEGIEAPPAHLRLTPAIAPEELLEELPLGQGQVVGISRQEDRIFIAQWLPATASQPSRLRTWMLTLNDTAAITVLSTQEQDLDGLDEGGLNLAKVQPLWVDAATLVWFIPAKPESWHWWKDPNVIQNSAAPQTRAGSVVMALCPLRLGKDALIAEEAQVFPVQAQVMHVSPATFAGGFVFFSYDHVEGSSPAGHAAPEIKVPLRPRAGEIRSWLQVVDFRSGTPLLRDAVSIPGQLLGVRLADSQGAVLVTQSELMLRAGFSPTRVVHASAYDGVKASLLSDYVTATAFDAAASMDEAGLYLARETGRPGVVSIRYDAMTGRLSQASAWNTNALPILLQSIGGHLLASSPGHFEVASIAPVTGQLNSVASFDTPINLILPVERATNTAPQDLWIPVGEQGVELMQKQALGSY